MKWRKSSRSGNGGNSCVELAALETGTVGVRDSKHPDGPVHKFAVGDMAAFLTDVRGGRYDQ